MWGPQEELLRAPVPSSTDSTPTGFHSQVLWGLIFLALESWAGGPEVDVALFTPEISLWNFYPPYVVVGPARSESLPLLPVWMDVVSLIL